MNIKSLETFFWISKLGSFRAAAKKLHASQPTISARISGLENTLGVDLFDRSGRNAVLTIKGRQALSYAEKILQLHTELLENVASPDMFQGTIRLGVAETITYTWLPKLIESINVSYPGINIELDIDISINLSNKLVKREIDIAFFIGDINQGGFFNVAFASYPLIWVASPKLNLPHEPITLFELARIPIITYPRMSEPHANIRTLINNMENFTQIHSSSSLSTIIRMAIDGIGISALPKEIIKDELATGQLREFQVEANVPDLVFNMAYCSSPSASIVRAVADLSLKIVTSEAD